MIMIMIIIAIIKTRFAINWFIAIVIESWIITTNWRWD